jgi:hypothetical protein
MMDLGSCGERINAEQTGESGPSALGAIQRELLGWIAQLQAGLM